MTVITSSNVSPGGFAAYSNALASSVTGASGAGSPPSDIQSSGVQVDTVDLSDRAKATLARAKYEQAAAKKLASQLSNTGDVDDQAKTNKPASDEGPSLFDKLTGRTSQSAAQVDRNDRDAQATYLKSRLDAHRAPDGSINSFSESVSDFITVPTTPAQIDEWYNTDGQSVIWGAQNIPGEAATGIGEAAQNRAITFLNAKDIPDLNFTNTVTFQGGETGASAGGRYSYNRDAVIFKDPTMSYRVISNGTVMAWKTPPASAALTSPADRPGFVSTPFAFATPSKT